MTVSLRSDQPGAPGEKASKPDIYDILTRMLIGLVINYVTKRLRSRQDIAHERRVAARKMEKLAGKGKKVPEELVEQATAGLSKREQKKVAAKAAAKGKKKAKKKAKKKSHKLLWIIAIAAAVAVAVKAVGKR
jgi:hypothetical protein